MAPSCFPRWAASRYIWFDLERSKSKFDLRSKSLGDSNRSCCISVVAPRKANSTMPSSMLYLFSIVVCKQLFVASDDLEWHFNRLSVKAHLAHHGWSILPWSWNIWTINLCAHADLETLIFSHWGIPRQSKKKHEITPYISDFDKNWRMGLEAFETWEGSDGTEGHKMERRGTRWNGEVHSWAGWCSTTLYPPAPYGSALAAAAWYR